MGPDKSFDTDAERDVTIVWYFEVAHVALQTLFAEGAAVIVGST